MEDFRPPLNIMTKSYRTNCLCALALMTGCISRHLESRHVEVSLADEYKIGIYETHYHGMRVTHAYFVLELVVDLSVSHQTFFYLLLRLNKNFSQELTPNVDAF
ncbi:hypothetical protein TNIN_307631 [Trichonephila inaurata madagascariensis]|uniref:Uncharacterized protein n=1 Tax=Trichonephila inaurata madagascariensis TaxID=2747483 RepID=A0A8X6IR79_9ARAC|nr:hypothetical protein TNIN_307631 [Trichonephila inaurata madagascariensis]